MAAANDLPQTLVGISFDDAFRAQEFMTAAARLASNGKLKLLDAVVVAKKAEGETRVVETIDPSPGRSALSGAMWAGLLGLLLGGPVGWLAGGVLGAGAGAVTAKVVDLGVPDEWVEWFRQAVRPDTTTVVLLLTELNNEALAVEAERFRGAQLVYANLDAAAFDRLSMALGGTTVEPFDVPEPAPDAPRRSLARIDAWTVTAQNLPEHAGNAIHTDDGARAAGFPRALVAGVTTYAYLAHPAVTAWGLDWVGSGGGEVRFRSPVFEHDLVRCTPSGVTAEGASIDALVGDDDRPRATLVAVRSAGPPRRPRDGERLRDRHVRLEGEWTDDYALRAGDDLDIFTDLGIVHPAVWPGIANRVMSADLVRGSWIHTRSLIRHHATAPVGATVYVEAVVVERFQRSGERAIVDMSFTIDGHPVVTIEHEAIIALPDPP